MREDEKPIIFIPREGNYIEILGHKIDGYNSFESFLEELKELKDVREKNKELEKERDGIYQDYQDLGKEKLKLEKEVKQRNKYWGNKIAEYHKVIELMAENIYNTSDTLNMLDIGKEINYDLEKLFNGIDDTEALKIIIDYFRKKAKGE